LGEIVVIERGGSPRPIEKYITELNDGLNWIKIGDAPTQGRYITKTSEKIKESGLSKTRQVFPGDLILSNSMSFGKPYIMEIEGCIHDGWLLIRDKNNVFDLKFLCHMLSTEYLLNQYKMFAAGSTVNNLNKELVGNASVRFPEMLEQNKIGKYLESLDHLITLHQSKPFGHILKVIASYTLYWEQRKLLSITTMHARIGWQNLRTTEFLDDGKYLLITGTDFVDGKIDFTRCYYVKQERYNQDRNIQIKNGCILITKDGTLGKVAYVNGLNKPATLNAGIFNVEIRDENKVDRLYLYQYIKAPFLLEYVNQMATGGTIKHLNQNILVDFMVSMPQSMEQKKIGELFQILDHLITLHQRKLEKLKIIKRSMLENLFPKNGEKTPKIRFSGFTEDWEQRKAKELCTIGTGESNTQDQAEDGMYTFYIRSEIPVKSNKYLYDCEAVITIGDGNIGRVFHYVNGKFDLHQRCYKMTDFENVWGKYFYYFFSTRFYDRAMKMTAKATVDSVRIEMISEMYILKPAEINEQKNIADFFTHLDHLITLHQLEPFKLIFKAIAYRIIDYAKSKPPRYIKYADLN